MTADPPAIDGEWTPKAWRLGLGGAVLLSALLRLRFLFAPISADEGGFLAIARAWRHGAVLYRDVWVDRPQGLLITYRLYDTLSLGHTAGLRVISIVFGAVAVVAVGWAVRSVATPAAGIAAAVLAAVMSSAPAIEGFAANGELLSGAMSAASLALAVGVLSGRLTPRWMYVAGVVGGVGFSLKQSGIDGPLAVGAWLALVFVAGWMPRRDAAMRFVHFVGGSFTVIALLVIHGALTDWHDFWYALVGYRLDQRSALVGADWHRLELTWLTARNVLLPAVIIVAIAAAVIWRQRGRVARSAAAGVLFVWPLTGLLAFLSGGQFFEHYWVILTFPIAAFGGLLIGALPLGRWRVAVVGLALVPALVSFFGLAAIGRNQIPVKVSGYRRATKEERVGQWFGAHHAPGETLYVLCASAATYAHAHEDPPYPYLWIDNVNQVPGAVTRLGALLAGAQRPTYVAEFQSGSSCGGQKVTDLIDHGYRPFTTVDGVRILKADSAG
jgi:hypothetical protein